MTDADTLHEMLIDSVQTLKTEACADGPTDLTMAVDAIWEPGTRTITLVPDPASLPAILQAIPLDGLTFLSITADAFGTWDADLLATADREPGVLAEMHANLDPRVHEQLVVTTISPDRIRVSAVQYTIGDNGLPVYEEPRNVTTGQSMSLLHKMLFPVAG